LTTTESVAPPANPTGTEQLIVCVPVHVHPPVEDERLVTFRFVGTLSDTVTICVVGPAPVALLSASVNVPVPFTATRLFAGVLASVSDGGTVTMAVAFGGVGHCAGVPQPPLFADTVFVYGEPTPEVTV
jgi:hypothetical protein